MPGLLIGGLCFAIAGVLTPLALTDPDADALPLVALALWLALGLLALLRWARSAPPRPALLFSDPVCRQAITTPGALPILVHCYEATGEVSVLDAELLPAPA